MPRPPRSAPAGGIFHITSRGNRRQSIFFDDDDRRWFLRLLDGCVTRFGWRCHAYCLMDNHVHLLLETPEANLSAGMQWLFSRYAQDFNWRHGLDGHVFQGRFASTLVTSDSHLIELGRYIVLNPVRANMRRAAGEWPWSSYRAAIGAARRPSFLELDWLLSQFGHTRATARAAYERFVSEAAARASPDAVAFPPLSGA